MVAMRIYHAIVFFLFFLPCAYAQVDYSQLIHESAKWTIERAENLVDNRIPDLYDYQQNNINRLYKTAKLKYDPILVFHAEVLLSSDREDKRIKLLLEESEMPFDLYYTEKGKTKVVIPSYQGKFEYAETHYSATYRRMGFKTSRALRRVLRRKPEIIFIWGVYPFNYMYIKGGDVYYIDSFTGKSYLLIESIAYLKQKIRDYIDVMSNIPYKDSTVVKAIEFYSFF